MTTMSAQSTTNWQIAGRLATAPFLGLGLVVGLPILGFWVTGKAIVERLKKEVDKTLLMWHTQKCEQ